MAKPEVKNAIRSLADDPAGIQRILDDKNARKAEVQKRGLGGANRKEIADEIKKLLSEPPAGGGASPQRAVDWFTGVATLAAGALAA